MLQSRACSGNNNKSGDFQLFGNVAPKTVTSRRLTACVQGLNSRVVGRSGGGGGGGVSVQEGP
jgi:hypothetical protein